MNVTDGHVSRDVLHAVLVILDHAVQAAVSVDHHVRAVVLLYRAVAIVPVHAVHHPVTDVLPDPGPGPLRLAG